MIEQSTTRLMERGTDRIAESLANLSPANLNLIASLLRQMDNSGGANHFSQSYINRPSDGVLQWVAMMKSERYSPNTVFLYRRFAEWHLKFDPNLTKLGLQSHFAKRLEEGISTAAVECERKALRSLFSFLKEESLWHKRNKQTKE